MPWGLKALRNSREEFVLEKIEYFKINEYQGRSDWKRHYFKSNILIFISDSSGIEKSIFTVGLNGFGYALDMENSIGNTSSISSLIKAILPQKPDERMVLLDSKSPINACPTVPVNFEFSADVFIAMLEMEVCLRRVF